MNSQKIVFKLCEAIAKRTDGSFPCFCGGNGRIRFDWTDGDQIVFKKIISLIKGEKEGCFCGSTSPKSVGLKRKENL